MDYKEDRWLVTYKCCICSSLRSLVDSTLIPSDQSSISRLSIKGTVVKWLAQSLPHDCKMHSLLGWSQLKVSAAYQVATQVKHKSWKALMDQQSGFQRSLTPSFRVDCYPRSSSWPHSHNWLYQCAKNNIICSFMSFPHSCKPYTCTINWQCSCVLKCLLVLQKYKNQSYKILTVNNLYHTCICSTLSWAIWFHGQFNPQKMFNTRIFLTKDFKPENFRICGGYKFWVMVWLSWLRLQDHKLDILQQEVPYFGKFLP